MTEKKKKKKMVKEFKRIEAVSFFGFADAKEGGELYKEARKVACLMAKRGVTIVNGGGPGVMKAATEGAHDGGGRAEIATFYPEHIENFEGKDEGNKADKEVVTKNYLERTLKLMEMGNAYVVFNGGTGTVSEFGMAWGLAKLYLGHHKPLILYGKFWEKIMKSLVENMKIRPLALKAYKIVDSPEEAVKALWEYELALRKGMKNNGKGKKTGEDAFIN